MASETPRGKRVAILVSDGFEPAELLEKSARQRWRDDNRDGSIETQVKGWKWEKLGERGCHRRSPRVSHSRRLSRAAASGRR